MSDLTPDDRALLDLARGGHDPAAVDRDRVRTALAAQLGIAAGLVSSSAGAAAGASAAGGVLSGAGVLAAKILGAVAIVGSVCAGGVAIHRALRVAAPAAPPPAASLVVPPPRAIEPATTLRLPVTSALGSDVPAAMPALETAPFPEPTRPRATAPPVSNAERTTESAKALAASPSLRRPDPRADRPIAAASAGSNALASDETHDDPGAPGDAVSRAPAALSTTAGIETNVPVPTAAAATLLAETELMRAGLSALHGGDPARALALFDQHARAFPAGVLADERDVERITALCDLGRSAEARAAAVSFLSRRPGAPLTGRVLSSCGSPSRSIP
jgi:hypothetical protein